MPLLRPVPVPVRPLLPPVLSAAAGGVPCPVPVLPDDSAASPSAVTAGMCPDTGAAMCHLRRKRPESASGTPVPAAPDCRAAREC